MAFWSTITLKEGLKLQIYRGSFSKKPLENMKYRFVEIKIAQRKEIASSDEFEDARNMGVAVILWRLHLQVIRLGMK